MPPGRAGRLHAAPDPPSVAAGRWRRSPVGALRPPVWVTRPSPSTRCPGIRSRGAAAALSRDRHGQKPLGISGRIAAVFSAQRDHAAAGAGRCCSPASSPRIRHARRRAPDRRHHGQRAGAFPGASAARDVEALVAAGRAHVVAHRGRRARDVGVAPGHGGDHRAVTRSACPTRRRWCGSTTRWTRIADWLSPQLGSAQPLIKPKGIDDVPIVALTLDDDRERAGASLQQVSRAIETGIKRIPAPATSPRSAAPATCCVDMDIRAHERVAGVTRRTCAPRCVANASQPVGSLVADNREVLVQTGPISNRAGTSRAGGRAGPARQAGLPADVAEASTVLTSRRRSTSGSARRRSAEPARHRRARGLFPRSPGLSKKPGANAADVARQVCDRVENWCGRGDPDGVQVTVTRDYGQTANRQGGNS